MTELPLTYLPDERLIALDRKVDTADHLAAAAEGDGIIARWEFGAELLLEREGKKKLPDGRLDEVASLIGKSRTEIQYRVRFAERFPTEDSLHNAIAQFGSWYRIVNDALGTSPFDVGTSGQEAWYTPQWVFDGLGITFDLDVAAPPGGVPWIPARRYFTETDDGLAQQWEGVVWCNPPYSAPTAWCHRFAQHPDMAILIRADLSTGGPFTALQAADAIWAPQGRLAFVDGVGQRGGLVTFSTVMFGRGQIVVDAMLRLAAEQGGTTRTLT